MAERSTAGKMEIFRQQLFWARRGEVQNGGGGFGEAKKEKKSDWPAVRGRIGFVWVCEGGDVWPVSLSSRRIGCSGG